MIHIIILILITCSSPSSPGSTVTLTARLKKPPRAHTTSST